MVANKRNVNTLRLAGFEDSHAFRDLVIVAVDLQRHEISLRSYSLTQITLTHQQRRSDRLWKRGRNV